MKRLVALLGSIALLACSGSKSPTKSEAGGAAPPAVATNAVAELPPPDPREADLAQAIAQLIERHHLRDAEIDDALSQKAFALYLERLDPGKNFLLQKDAERLASHADQIDDQLRSGRLTLAHDGARVFAERLAVVEKVVAELLAAPFDHTDEEWIELDPEKLELAATEQELRDRWRQRLELEVLERVALMEEQLAARAKPAADKKAPDDAAAGDAAAGDAPETIHGEIPETAEGREAKARADLAARYAGRFARLARPDKLEAAADLINAVTAALDPHTVYLPPADEANFDIAMTGSLEGIGAVLREHDHYIEVVEIIPGSASWRQGILKPGDLILAVAQEGKKAVDVGDMRIDEVVAMIRGKKNTVVELTIQKPSGDVSTIAITRDEVVVEEAYARGAALGRKGDSRTYGYVHLPSFYGGHGAARSAADDVRALLEEAAERKVAGVVLDLRSNGGGLLDDAVELTGLLIDRGPVVQTQRRGGEHEVLRDPDRGVVYDGPVVVLVDRFTASASEIVAGALQDYQRAIIVGTSATHGKGTVQVLADLDRPGRDPLGDLKLTIQQYFRISGSSVQSRGVVPDILLPDLTGHLETGERHLDNAIPWTEIAAVEHTDWTPTWKLDELAAASQARVGADPVLSRVATAAELLRRRQGETRTPLAKEAWVKHRETRRAELEAATPELDDAPARLTVTTLDLDDQAADERITAWRDGIAKDPWLDEALAILAAAVGPPPADKAPAKKPAKTTRK